MLRSQPQTSSLANGRVFSLNGEWAFQLDPMGELGLAELAPTQTIPVPLPWQALSPEMRAYKGYAWYSRTFDLSADFLAGEALLRFGAVDYWCEVFVNGVKAGEHEGGFTPFTLAVGRLLTPGKNTLTVRVFDPILDKIEFYRWAKDQPAPDSQIPFAESEIPHGKQEWYVNIGGIWQDVTLEAVPTVWIEQIRILPDVERETAQVTVKLAGQPQERKGGCLVLTAHTAGGEVVAAARATLKSGSAEYSLELALPNPRLWSLEDPHLYTLHARLEIASGGQHEKAERFGMRTFETRDGQFLLNGQPVYLLAALDQDFYPETIFTVPSEEYLRDQFRKAKELGLNMLRIHIKIPEPIYLDLADEMGLLVWAEIPSWRTVYPRGTYDPERLKLSDDTRRRVIETYDAMVTRDFNHPSLVIRTLVNEDWGTTLAHSPDDRRWVAELYDTARQLDPTRLVVDNSPCLDAWTPNLHVKTDVEDFHIYTSYPEGIRSWQGWVKALARRPLWTFSNHGDSTRSGDEPLVLSEFGNWSLPCLSSLRRSAGIDSGEPEWMNVLPWGASIWDKQMAYPTGVEERFVAYGLSQIWPSYDDFARATQWSQYQAMKHEIEVLRREPRFQGYVITEMTDVYWEANGLLDFARNPKAYHAVFKQVNAPDVVSAEPDRWVYWSGETAELNLYVSHYSGKAQSGATIVWGLEGDKRAGSISLPPAPRGTAGHAGKLFFTLPAVNKVTVARLTLKLINADGRELANNSLDLTLYPLNARAAAEVGLVYVPSADAEPVYGGAVPENWSAAGDQAGGSSQAGRSALASALTGLGYRTAPCLSADVKLAIASEVNDELLNWVRAGGNLLYLADGHSPFFWLQGRGGVYGGAWVSAWSWVRPETHPRVAPKNPLGVEYLETLPCQTILGFPYEQAMADGDVLAGMVAGWVHNPAAHTLQFRLGKGRVVMTTFRLAPALGRDPIATAMLNDLAAYVVSDTCQPTLSR